MKLKTACTVTLTAVLLASVFSFTRGWCQERVRLRVSTLFIGSSLLPMWIGQDLGYFKRAGVDVELISMQSNLSTSALLAGEVDVIFGSPQVPLTLLSSKNPPNFVSIAAWASGSEHWLVVNPSIKSVKELEGKMLATSRPKSADHGYQLVILERNGVDTRGITFLICWRTIGTGSRCGVRKSYGVASQPLLYSCASKKRIPPHRAIGTAGLSISSGNLCGGKR